MGNVSHKPVLQRNKTPEGREKQLNKLTEDDIAQLRTQFDLLDLNGNGVLDEG